MSVHPQVLWAQRSSATEEQKNVIYLTVNLPDIQEDSLQYVLTQTSISFSAKAGDASKNVEERTFAFTLDFFADVVPELSTKKLTSRSFVVVLRKKENKAEYWPRLTEKNVKNAFLKTDFSKWVDEDEQDGDVALPEDDEGMVPPGMAGMGGGMPGGMDFEKMMAQMGGGGGMPDFSGSGEAGGEDDSDDDGPPPLEEAEAPK
ncbi:hypothetical protein H0H87_010213 [Tephrocybe sp. NHM501043]|nr:hypothetical protein H0H87_010213 [Tephrocybe sp. NHM501043]